MVSPAVVALGYLGMAVLSVLVAGDAWQRRHELGGRPVVVALLGAAGVSLCHAGVVLSGAVTSAVSPAVAFQVGYVLALDAAVLGALFTAVEYTRRPSLERPAVVGGLVVVSVVLSLADAAETVGVAGVPGAAHFVEGGYQVLLGSVIVALFAQRALTSRGVYRTQAALLAGGFGMATAVAVPQLLFRFEPINLIPVGITAGVVLVALALRRYRFLATTPIAKETLFDHLADPVIAIAADGTIVTCNDPARSVFGLARPEGRPVSSVFEPTPGFGRQYEDVLDGDADVGVVATDGHPSVDPDHRAVDALLDGTGPMTEEPDLGVYTGDGVRFFHVTSSPVDAGRGPAGRLVVFREITAEKERERELDLLKQVLTRILRHNIRNDMNAIQGFASIIHERHDGQTAELAANIASVSERLAETSEKARRIEDVIDADEPVEVRVGDAVRNAVRRVREQYPEAEYELDVDDGLVVRANPKLQTAIAATVENAVEHDEDDPRVRVSTEADGSWIEITIRDDGPGIPRSELETLERGGETPLVHGSGAGLWLTATVVDRSDGDLAIEVDDGTTVRVRLPAGD